MDDPVGLIEKYKEELSVDTYIDSVNVLEKAYSLPSVRHKWNGRYHDAKVGLYRLVVIKDSFIDDMMETDNPLRLSRGTIAARVSKSPQYRALLEKIFFQETLVEYLKDAISHNISKMGYDVTNICNLRKEDMFG